MPYALHRSWRRVAAPGAFLAGLLAAFPACAADRSVAPGTERGAPALAVATVEVAPSAMTLYVGQTGALGATPRDESRAPVAGARIVWTTTDEGVARVDASGIVTALKPGTLTVRATSGDGTFGEAVVVVEPMSIVINEIMPDPRAVADNVGEWFEVYNYGGASVELRGWKIASANDAEHTITERVLIPAHGFAVLARDGDPATNGGVTAAYVYAAGTATLNLNNSNTDWLVLRHRTGATVDSVAWGTSSPPSGASRALTDPTLDNTLLSGTASNWITSTSVFGAGDRGTPGAANDGATSPPVGGVITSVTVAPSTITVTLGATRQFGATARDAASTVVATTFTWTSSDPLVATINASGLATALAAGTTIITATAANGVSGTATLSVPAPSAVYRNHLEFGTPRDGDPSDDFLIQRPQYALSYNPVRNVANWVSWDLNWTHFGDAPRCDCFLADPALPASFYQVVSSDYTGSGYSRGHLVRSEERTSTAADNATTFYMTNILPQLQELNGGPWAAFELYLEGLARVDRKELYIVAGGIFPPNPATLNGQGKVPIPGSTWKIVLILPEGQGLANVTSASSIQVIAVNMPNVAGVAGTAWQSYRTTVDAIEAATGYDFLASLPDIIEALVESQP
ncbi:MAG: DNA/RNA non-specific endonuclease [Gemmatimonadaceae bacterium]